MVLLLKILKWLFICLASLFIVIITGGIIYQEISESRDLARFPAPGRLVDVDGRFMHIHCRGQGSPTVVLELGIGSVSATWDEMHQRLAAVTRVCAYDRAGLGYSEPFDHPRRATDVANLLHELLQRAGIRDDLILVGWSAGGVYIREFHQQFPEQVSAMLFVDSSHEQQANRMPQMPGSDSNSTPRIAKYLAPIGLIRMSGILDRRVDSSSASEELKPRLKALYNQSHALATVLKESDAFDLDIDASQPPAPIGDLPLIVLTRGKPVELPEGSPPNTTLELLQQERKARNELQQELTALSNRGKQIIAEESGHHIYLDQPELLIESVTELVSLAREQRASQE